MKSHRKTFRTNRDEGKVLGVCAGIADHFGVDVTLVRVAVAVAAVMTFPVIVIAYFVIALVADRASRPDRPEIQPRSAEARKQMHDLDVRLQALERELTSSGNRLSREIDALR